jgi:hypothetical protein
MNSSRSSSVKASAFALALAAAAIPAHAACPTNEFFHGGIAEPLDVAAFDTTLGTAQGNENRDAYDLVAGTIHVYHPGSLSPTWFKLHDDFGVEGVPAGTLVPVTLEVSVAGWIATGGCGGSGCWGWVQADVASPTDAQTAQASFNLFGPEQRPFTFTVSTQAVLEAGAATPISIQLSAGRAPGGSHYAMGDATYRFLGLPPGAYVTSCRGYVDPATPARPASWGQLKAAYR